MSEVVPAAGIETRILHLRGHKVLLDSDLAELYGVTTKRLNEQVKRNMERFPEDFMFKLSIGEKQRWSQNATTSKICGFQPYSLMFSRNTAP